jgi:hypothetical protein
MQPDDRNETKEELVRKIGKLEDVYAQAFADEVDEQSLSRVWERIKLLKGKLMNTDVKTLL